MARLDLFLKNAGLIKQRSEAKRACEASRVQVDGAPAKPGREIRVGEIVSLELETCYAEVEVLKIPQRPLSKKQRQHYYCILRREDRDPSEDLSF